MASNATKKKTTEVSSPAVSSKKPASSGSRKAASTGNNRSSKKTAADDRNTTTAGSRKTASSGGTKTASRGERGSRDKSDELVLPGDTAASGSDQPDSVLALEAVLWLILALCVFIFISFFGIGGYIGTVISDVCFGIFGISAYLFPFLLFLAAAFVISNRGNRLAGVKLSACVVLYLCICCFAALIEGDFGETYNLSLLYARCASSKQGGGAVGGTVCYFLTPALGSIGTGVLLTVLALIAVVLITQKSLLHGMKKQGRRVYQSAKESSEKRKEERKNRGDWERFEEMSVMTPETEPVSESAPKTVFQSQRMSVSSGRRGSDTEIPSGKPLSAAVPERQLDVSVMFAPQTGMRRHHRHVSGVTLDTRISGETPRVGAEVQEILPKPYEPTAAFPDRGSCYIDLEEETALWGGSKTSSAPAQELYQEIFPLHIEGVDDTESAKEEVSALPHEDLQTDAPDEQSPDDGRSLNHASAEQSPDDGRSLNHASAEQLPDDRRSLNRASDEPSEEERDFANQAPAGQSRNTPRPAEPSAGDSQSENTTPPGGKIKRNPRSSEQEIADGIASVEAEAEQAARAVRPEYVFPPLELLKKGGKKTKKGQEQEIRQTAAKLQQTLNSFGVHVTVTNVSCGPSVTRYELLPEQGVKVSRIVSLSDDIKLNLAAADIRIEAPIPGKSAVGIEVPNAENSTVPLRDLLESDEFQNHSSKLAFATGKDIGGKVVVSDIAKMPHLLIAGATGSGKSVCINTLIMSILYKAKPEEVKLIMIDPKVVELSVYNGIPHLMIPVVTDPKKAAGALNWGVAEMTDRYAKFAEVGVRDLKGYNQKIEALKDIDDPNKPEKLPQIVIIVDELADLMMVAPGEVEDSICRLAQLARAAGIHLIIATQRPSVNVITGLIKANMPSRIAFSVSSGVDSRTIIDMYGAEKLLGKGDMLFYPQGYQKPARVQGAFVSDEEVSDVVDFLKNSNTSEVYNQEMEQQIAKVQQAAAASKSAEDTDELFTDAGKFIIEKDKASIGMLQRVFKIGFNRAARIMDQLSDAGVVGPEEGTKPRKILMSMEQFENYLEEN